MFNLIDLPEEVPAFPGLDIEPIDVAAAGVDFDLFLSLIWERDALRADLAYPADRYTDSDRRPPAGAARRGARRARWPDPTDHLPDRWPRPSRPRRPIGCRVTVAASFAVDRVQPVIDLWTGLLDAPLSVRFAPPHQVLRPLLDRRGPLGGDPDGLDLVLVRWQDWLHPDPGAPAAVSSALERLERLVPRLCHAVGSTRRHHGTGLVLAVCPPSPEWTGQPGGPPSPRPPTGCAGAAPAIADVEVVDLASWARTYGLPEPDGDEALAVFAGTVIVRQALRRWGPRIRTLLVDPRIPGVGRVLRRQLQLGRRVVLTARPAAPDVAALVTAGAVELAADGAAAFLRGLADAGTDPGICLVLQPDDAAVAALRTEGFDAVAVAGGHAAVLDRLWPLDPPAPAGAARIAVAGQRWAEIATELTTVDTIGQAARFGYRPAGATVAGQPRTDAERVLAGIWADLLQVPQVGIHDDFFDLGGDSLLAIGMVFQAAEAGIAITPRQVMQHPTIAQLCAAATEPVPAVDAEQAVVGGEAPLTAAQEWFLAEIAPGMARPSHFNHPYYLRLHRSVPPAVLAGAVERLAAHHDSLRLRFRRTGSGWRQYHAALADAVPFTSYDVSSTGLAERESAVEALAAAEQTTLDLEAGPTVRVAHVHLGGDEPDRLLIVAHHLAVDAVSRGVILEDLQVLCDRLAAGQPATLPPKTTSYRRWAHRLHEHAQSDQVRGELDYWLAQAGGADGRLAAERPGGAGHPRRVRSGEHRADRGPDGGAGRGHPAAANRRAGPARVGGGPDRDRRHRRDRHLHHRARPGTPVRRRRRVPNHRLVPGAVPGPAAHDSRRRRRVGR